MRHVWAAGNGTALCQVSVCNVTDLLRAFCVLQCSVCGTWWSKAGHSALNVISSSRCVRHYCSKIKLTWWKIMWENTLSSRASSCRFWTHGVNLVLISETSQGRNACWLSKQLGPTCCQRTVCSLVVYLRSFLSVMECNVFTFQQRKGKFWYLCQNILKHLSP